MYDEIRGQIPNPYYPNELYAVSCSMFSPIAKYYATVNNRGFLHIYKLTTIKNTILLERFRFTKQKKLVFMNEYLLAPKDGEIYNKYKRLNSPRKGEKAK